MSGATWILTKLGDTHLPVICSSHPPYREKDAYDMAIGQSCFEKNWYAGNLVDISPYIGLAEDQPVFAFKDYLDESGINIPM